MRSSGIIKNLQLPEVIDRIPKLCASPDELRAGDRLIFIKSPRNRAIGGKITTTQQSMLNEEGAHSEACHTGFVVNIDGKLKLAHLVGDGFFLESLDDPQAKYVGKYLSKTTIVFRPTKHVEKLNQHLTELVMERLEHESQDHNEHLMRESDNLDDMLFSIEDRHVQNQRENLEAHKKKLRERIAESVKNLKHKFQLQWSAGVAIRSFIHRLVSSLRLVNRNPDRKIETRWSELPDTVIAKDSICSKYDADTFVSAANRMTKADPLHRNYRSIFNNASTLTTPKTLWAYLARNFNYDYLIMPHARDKIFSSIVEKIQIEIARLAALSNPQSQSKARELSDLIDHFNKAEYQDDLLASIGLLKVAKPILLKNTGSGVRTPQSYKNVMRYARQQGIYPEHIHRNVVDPVRHGVTQLAREHYGYGYGQAKQYSRYRRLGFSDKEARFECASQPEFGDWYKLSPGRNIALTCTVVGFFAWVLPRGLWCAHQVKKRNAMLPHDEPAMKEELFKM